MGIPDDVKKAAMECNLTWKGVVEKLEAMKDKRLAIGTYEDPETLCRCAVGAVVPEPILEFLRTSKQIMRFTAVFVREFSYKCFGGYEGLCPMDDPSYMILQRLQQINDQGTDGLSSEARYTHVLEYAKMMAEEEYPKDSLFKGIDTPH